MAQVRKGDTVRAFLDANVFGIVESITYVQDNSQLMVGGVPPTIALASVRLSNGMLHRIKTTELFVENAVNSR